MKTKAEIIEQIKTDVRWEIERGSLGGQSCGMPNYPVTLISDDFSIKITVGYLRSQLKNKQLAMDLFELALMELIKLD